MTEDDLKRFVLLTQSVHETVTAKSVDFYRALALRETDAIKQAAEKLRSAVVDVALTASAIADLARRL